MNDAEPFPTRLTIGFQSHQRHDMSRFLNQIDRSFNSLLGSGGPAAAAAARCFVNDGLKVPEPLGSARFDGLVLCFGSKIQL